MIEFDYDFSGSFSYERYAEVINRVKDFPYYKSFGMDQSGDYEMFYIGLGTEGKPVIMLMASMHGTEWQATQYSMYFMEQIRDNTFPDVDFRNYLLENFFIVYVPMLNPHGYDRVLQGEYGEYTSGNYDARHNANGIELNSDFYSFNERESRNLRELGEKYKPFSFLDMHMFQPDYSVSYDRNAILASGQQDIPGYQKATLPYRDIWKESMENYLGEEITVWGNLLSSTSGLARGYFGRQKNPFTEFTLSYITEIVRPAYKNRDGEMKLIRKLTNEEIYKYGFTHLYLFFKTSTQYYEDNKDSGDTDVFPTDYVYKIKMDHKTVTFTRNIEGIVLEILEEYDETCDNMIIKTTFDRNSEGNVTNILREKIG